MIEKALEACVVGALKAAYEHADVGGVVVRGAWQRVDDGLVKGLEGGEAADVFVQVAPRSYDVFGISIVTFNVLVALDVRAEHSPDGAMLEECAAPIAGWLESVNAQMNCENDCGLGAEGFVPGSVQLSGGSGPNFDADAGAWRVTWNFSVRGNINT